jgi:RecA/RadA recombinase
MSIIEKLKKNSTIKDSAILTKSKFFNKKDIIQTQIPALNVALSGSLDGGLTPGLTMWAGPSKHFKTLFSLILAKAYMDKYPEAAMIFWDSEFGTPLSYFDSIGIDKDRVLHVPFLNIEQLKHDVMKQVNDLVRDDRVIFVVDSIGNSASSKEITDAIDGKVVADMTRAKALNSFFRMITPYLNVKNIPMVIVNRTYKTLEMYAKDVVAGGGGSYFAADNIYILGRQQDKEGTELVGYNFIINVEKSRYVKEKSKIPITVKFEGGLSKWSGLLEMALESGHVVKPSNGWYSKIDSSTGEVEEKKYRIKYTSTSDFWLSILKDKTFKSWIADNYQISNGNMISDEDVAESIDSLVGSDEEIESPFPEEDED